MTKRFATLFFILGVFMVFFRGGEYMVGLYEFEPKDAFFIGWMACCIADIATCVFRAVRSEA